MAWEYVCARSLLPIGDHCNQLHLTKNESYPKPIKHYLKNFLWSFNVYADNIKVRIRI